MRIVGARFAVAAWLAVSLVTACAGRRGAAPGIDARFVAVHNAFVGIGMAQIGPIHQGSLVEGHESRVGLDLPAGCATIVVVGGEGLQEVDARLLDAQGKAQAHDTTSGSEAVIHACPDVAGQYVVVVAAATGSGPWTLATWQGSSDSTAAPAASASAGHQAIGTCDSPIPLSAGVVAGNTTHGEDLNSGACQQSNAREIVYELDIPERQRVVLEVEGRFDSVLYVRKDTCADPKAEVDCNDDAGSSRNKSRIEKVLEPGKYFVFVDGYNQEAGSYKLTVSTSSSISLNDACRAIPPLLPGTPVSGTLETGSDDANATCGGGAEGSETAWRLDLASPSRVRLVEHSDQPDHLSPVVYVRKACRDEESELACGESSVAPGDAALTDVFPAGSYTVFADARDRAASGSYSLLAETVDLAGSGVPGDGCGDALPLSSTTNVVSGDTLAAHDDVSGSCAGKDAPDVVYRIDVTHRSRLSVKVETEEGTHLLELWKQRCGDHAAEVSCGSEIGEIVDPGTYFLGVDGASATSFGRFDLRWGLRELAPQAGACASAPRLTNGHEISSSNVGAADRFASSCAGDGAGPDRVFRFDLAARSMVSVSLVTDFDAAVSLRKSCVDGAAKSSELECALQSGAVDKGRLRATLDAGSYFIVVEGQSQSDAGSFRLSYRAVTSR